MLGLGAYLVLQNELTPGAMIAGSILWDAHWHRLNWPLDNGDGTARPQRMGFTRNPVGEIPPEPQKHPFPNRVLG